MNEMNNHRCPSCLTCIHKNVCIKRSTAFFTLFIQPGRYAEIPDAQASLDIALDCQNWENNNKGDF